VLSIVVLISLLSVSASQAETFNQQPEIEDEEFLATSDLVAEVIEEDSAVDDAAVIQLPEANWPETDTVDLASTPPADGEQVAAITPPSPEETEGWEIPPFLQETAPQGTPADEGAVEPNNRVHTEPEPSTEASPSSEDLEDTQAPDDPGAHEPGREENRQEETSPAPPEDETPSAQEDSEPATALAAEPVAVTDATLEILDEAAAQEAGVNGVLMRLSRTDGVQAPGPVNLDLDYTDFATAFGGDYGSRLRLVALNECALDAEPAPDCQAAYDLGAVNDIAARSLSAVAPATASGVTLAAVPEADGDNGDYQATELAPSASWEVGLQTGDFSWSYPMAAPEVAGDLAPGVSLAYSSGSIDGRTASSNNQTSWIGEGFNYQPGFIERSYVPCSDDGQKAPNKTGDQCWRRHNATLSLNGMSSEILLDDDGTWRLRNDDGSKVERLTGATNGDNDGEYWKVTTADGTQYFFGRNRLPGWASGDSETNSALNAPVYGNDSGEPCHKSTFAESWCQQAWRWNLDYVVDVHGNVMTFYYTKEKNHYARNVGTVATPYDRSGYLRRIEYGLRSDDVYATAPARVVFTTGERCLKTDSFDCAADKRTEDNASRWPDVPQDQDCKTGEKCTGNYSPTFWTTRKLDKVTTQYHDGTEYVPVDSWALTHQFPAPGDGTDPALWLDSITHTGHVGGTLSTPALTFAGTPMPNRVDATSDGVAPMNKWRITAVYTESGSQLDVQYSQPECEAGEEPEPHDNTKRCYPVEWAPSGAGDEITDWFHKYVVTQVTEIDLVTDQPDTITTYDYQGGAAWRYMDADGFTKDDKRTWSQWRGYETVRVISGAEGGTQSEEEHRFFRGMHGDKQPSGTRSVKVADSEGTEYTDHDYFYGQSLETLTRNGLDGEVVDRSVTLPWHRQTASRTYSWGTLTANIVRTQSERSYTPTSDGGWRAHRLDTVYDDRGLPTEVFDHGDTTVSGDERCARTFYVHNSGKNIIGLVSRVESVAVGCDVTPTRPDDVTFDTRSIYDNGEFGEAPSRGLETESERLVRYDGQEPVYEATMNAAFDSYGRQTSETDAAGNTTTTAYSADVTHGLATEVAVTNPLGHRSVTHLDPARSLALIEIDPNGKKTELVYDPLGRLTQVWLPDRDRTRATPSLEFSYHLTKSQATYIATSTLNSQGDYNTTYEIYDGMLRLRQTQTPASGGGRLISDVLHDHRGLQVQTRTAYPTEGEPGGTVVLVNNTDEVPRYEQAVYDGAGRVVHTLSMSRGVEQWRTTTEYDGEQARLTAPEGGTGTTTITDVRGNTTELRHHHGREPVGDYDTTTYTYTPREELATVTDTEGNEWTNTYDLMGRKVSVTDPDTGTTTFTYDELDRQLTRTDARGETLAYAYDALGRTTAIHEGSLEGDQRASWVFDTLLKGQLTSATRYDSGNAYTNRVVAYDHLYRPVSSRITIPAAETGIDGTYQFTTRYNPDGSVKSQLMPAGGGLDVENISYTYDDLGRMTRVEGDGTYVDAAYYSKVGNLVQRSLNRGGARDRSTWVTWDYNEATNRLAWASVVPEVGSGSLLHQHYTYDDAGNILSIRDEPSDPDRQFDVQCFEYDHQRQLSQVWTPDATGENACAAEPDVTQLGGADPYWHAYAYDAVGNRTTETRYGPGGETTRTYEHPSSGQPQPHSLTEVEQTGPSGDQLERYAYDEAGNMVSRVTASADQVMEWDVEGRLVTVGDADLGVTTYLYDADGARLIRRDPTTTTLYLPGMEIHYEREDLLTRALRYYQHGEDTVAVRDASTGKVSWIFSDHHGTGQLAIDATTGEVAQRRFTAFGADRNSSGLWPDERGFVGGMIDDSTGLTQLGARAYDAAIGRFISVDPIMDVTDPQQMHGYAYANNNPVSYTDPDGLLARKALNKFRSKTKSKPKGTVGRPKAPYRPRSITSTARRTSNNFGRTFGSMLRTASRRLPSRKQTLGFVMGFGHSVLNQGAFGLGYRAGQRAGLPSYADMAEMLGIDTSSGSFDVGFTTTEVSRNAVETIVTTIFPVGRVVGAGSSAISRLREFALERTSGSCNSFASGTRVLMADGSHRAIEDVQIGDEVWATDPSTGDEGPRTVLATIVGEGTKTLVEITVDTATQIDAESLEEGVLSRERLRPGPTVLGDVITATGGHPFWVPELGRWVDAIDLQPGMWFLSSEDTLVQVAGVQVWVQYARVYNLTVKGIHTYYVLADAVSILVHNSNEIPQVDNERLQNIVNSMFHGLGNPNRVGDGSALAAANWEARGGSQVHGQNHLRSTTQIRGALRNFLDRDEIRLRGGRRVPVVRTERDEQVANSFIAAIDDAHAGRYEGLENYSGLGC
jgi:RHS repeat-associated protein